MDRSQNHEVWTREDQVRHSSRYDAAWRTAEAIAARRPDYRPSRADCVLEGDGVRLVPTSSHPVPWALAQPLVCYAVGEEFGLVALTLTERSEAVNQVLYGVSAPTHGIVVYDAEYPVLVR